ncbi:hypothetical protein B296_00011510 [Ensete ventricosum]|uniref:Uncharacterized protein n=1 Tax=Ensete ventricosum TaxID=4639 RepID=A0A427B814_ENSVE|nr:hypothetical protein B296_00011510 [Ensete ventricosum]
MIQDQKRYKSNQKTIPARSLLPKSATSSNFECLRRTKKQEQWASTHSIRSAAVPATIASFSVSAPRKYTEPNLNRRARQYAGTRLRPLNRGVFGCRFKIRDSTDHEINERLRNTDAKRSPWLSASHGLSSVILHINVRKPQKRQREVSES